MTSRRGEVQKTLNGVLAAAGRSPPNMSELIITDKSIVETGNCNGLTLVILDHDIPEIRGSVTVDHYTNQDAFRSIMQTQQLWMAPITRRLDQGELTKFAEEHWLYGFVEADGTSTELLKNAAADLFYTSFSEPSSSDHLWAVFGARRNGYRLRFEITAKGAGQLRKIRYHGGETLLKQVNVALRKARLPRFVLRGVSQVGAFYLPTTLKREEETRLLVRRFANAGAPVVAGPTGEHWPISIELSDPPAELKLTEIGVQKLDPVKVREDLPKWCASVSVVKD